jgi:hypothetical protein
MGKRDGAEVRKERIREITRIVLRYLHSHGEAQLSEMVAGLEYDTGLTQEKIMEYLNIAEKTGCFEIDLENDKIIPKVESAV